MKREIEFRGKTAKGEWVYGLLDYFGKDKYCIRTYDEERNGGAGYQVDENTISQFTGVTDKNGKKVYEGDIVKTNIIYSGIVKVFTKEEIVEVKYIDGCFYPLYDYEKGQIEVIGNIFDKESNK